MEINEENGAKALMWLAQMIGVSPNPEESRLAWHRLPKHEQERTMITYEALLFSSIMGGFETFIDNINVDHFRSLLVDAEVRHKDRWDEQMMPSSSPRQITYGDHHRRARLILDFIQDWKQQEEEVNDAAK